MLAIIQHTPLWVAALLALLVVLGVQALRPREVPVWRLLLVPLAFTAWGVLSLMQKAGASPLLVADWLVTAAIGAAIGWWTTNPQAFHIDHAGNRVRVPGSAVPLVRNLSIFLAKYVLAATMAVAPALQGALSPWDIAVSGLSAGYFIGWMVRFALRYRAGRQPQLLRSNT
ncbi:MAG TPA: DUF6622 family protein [Alphaproteobacteria bacterium]|nr:DUF6622 family protein [Alphaproteobacteria bacterium]